MNIEDLRKMTLPKLRELAKESTELQGVVGMKKEELIAAIAKAQGIAYEPPPKDVSTISAIKQEIRILRKQKQELLSSDQKDGSKVERIRKKVKKLKRLTRSLARQASAQRSAQPETAKTGTPAAAG